MLANRAEGAPGVATREHARRIRIIRPPSSSPRRLAEDLARLAEYRDLLLTLTLHRAKVRYKQSLLGLAWAVLQPVSLMLIYVLVFSLIVRMPSDGVPYALFAYAGLLPWMYLAGALTGATSSFVSQASLVTKVFFPREILPITYVIAGFLDTAIASAVLGMLLVAYGVALTPSALWAVPVLVVETCLITGLALVAAATQARVRDVGVAIPLVLQVWMFASPVVYPLSVVPGWLRDLYVLNPMAGIVDGFRRALVHGTPPDMHSLGIAALVAGLLLPAGYVYAKRADATLADRV